MGAAVAFYCQQPEFLGLSRERLRVSNRLQEKLALQLVYAIGRRHYEGGEPWSAAALARRLSMPVDVVAEVLEALERSGLVAESGLRKTTYIPGRPYEEVTLAEVLLRVRKAGEGPLLNADRAVAEPPVETLTDEIEASTLAALESRTIKEWVTGNQPLSGDRE